VIDQARVDLHYDYDQVSETHRETVRRSALNIKPRLKRAAEDIFVIGQELQAVKDVLPHGQYTKWLDVEFGLSERMAQHFMNVRRRLGSKSEKFSVLPPSTLYLLAAPSTPDEAIETVEEQLGSGERLGVSLVQQVIAEAKERLKEIPPSQAIIDGEVIHSTVSEAETAEQIETAKRLDEMLSQVFDMLSGQPAEDWGSLFHNSELTRVRNEIYQMRSELREKVLQTAPTL
jgi:hypothetical protein